MKEIDWIIKEQSILLKDKGYNETSLNSTEGEGSYKLHLKDKIQHILDLELTPFGTEPVSLPLFGYFNGDKVTFTFSYDFDLADHSLELKQVEARLGAVTLPVTIEEGRNLWKAKELYERVKQLHEGVSEHLNADWKTQLKENAFSNAQLIASKGYGQIESNNKEILNAIEKIKGNSSSAYSFQLQFKMQNRDSDNALTCRFHYAFYADKAHFMLKSIFFKAGNVSELVLKPKASQIPIPTVIYQRLQTKDAINQAALLQQKMDTSGSSIKAAHKK